MAFKKNRSVKVYERCGYNYRPTPTIMLKGQWLKELGQVVRSIKSHDRFQLNGRKPVRR